MTMIKVNPMLLNSYGQTASDQFQAMGATLGQLIADVNSLQYRGANAKAFKDSCATTAAEYVQFMNGALTTMANAILAATSNIERALGGQLINVSIPEVNVATTVEDAGGDVVVVDQAELARTKSNIEGYFDELMEQLHAHHRAFNTASSEWLGQAQQVASQEVEHTTKTALDQTAEAKAAMASFIASQYDSVDSADRSLQVG